MAYCHLRWKALVWPCVGGRRTAQATVTCGRLVARPSCAACQADDACGDGSRGRRREAAQVVDGAKEAHGLHVVAASSSSFASRDGHDNLCRRVLSCSHVLSVARHSVEVAAKDPDEFARLCRGVLDLRPAHGTSPSPSSGAHKEGKILGLLNHPFLPTSSS
uniref:Uncharacterized protein n=1 Tax=Oryza glumipatula TaxID=40148 RepID=A0A0D9ZUR9_9ORYZ